MAPGKGWLETLRRAMRTVFFMLTMVASLLVLSAPVLLAVGDVALSLVLASWFACARCYGVREHQDGYGFRSSLMDIPLVSVARSLVITCVYSLCDGPGLSHGPYLGTVTLCSFISIVILSVKASVFSPVLEMVPEDISPLVRQMLHLKTSWGMSVLFLSSVVFALGHVVIAYRTTCRARRKLLFHWIDPEAVLACRNVFPGHTKAPRSPTPWSSRNSKSVSEAKRKGMVRDEGDLPISLLADVDSLFMVCQGLTLHYKISVVESPLCHFLSTKPLPESSPNCGSPLISLGKLRYDRSLTVPSRIPNHITRSFSNHSQTSSLYAPLLADSATSPAFFSDEIPALSLEESSCDARLPNSTSLEVDITQGGNLGIVLVHGFGGGVFSWRHVMGVLAWQVGCPVVAFDRPGWGLSSRPCRKDWEERQLANPYGLESQVFLYVGRKGFSVYLLISYNLNCHLL